MYPLHATIEEFAANGYTHVEANCPRCRVIRLRAIDQLPKISMELTIDALARPAPGLLGLRKKEARRVLSTEPHYSQTKGHWDTALGDGGDALGENAAPMPPRIKLWVAHFSSSARSPARGRRLGF